MFILDPCRVALRLYLHFTSIFLYTCTYIIFIIIMAVFLIGHSFIPRLKDWNIFVVTVYCNMYLYYIFIVHDSSGLNYINLFIVTNTVIIDWQHMPLSQLSSLFYFTFISYSKCSHYGYFIQPVRWLVFWSTLSIVIIYRVRGYRHSQVTSIINKHVCLP